MSKLDPLFEAFKKGEWTLNQQTKEGNTLLHLAVIEDRPQIIEDLLSKGARPLPDQWGLTPPFLSHLLNRSNALVKKEERTLLIYRNRDEKVYPISISEFEERLKITYYDSLIFDSVDTIYKVAKKCARKLKKKKYQQMNHWTLCLHGKTMEKRTLRRSTSKSSRRIFFLTCSSRITKRIHSTIRLPNDYRNHRSWTTHNTNMDSPHEKSSETRTAIKNIFFHFLRCSFYGNV